MKKSIVCIVCPNGCEITAEIDNGKVLKVENAQCKRGYKYAEQEVTNPMRTIASLIAVENGDLPLVSVRTSSPIPKSRIAEIMNEIKMVKLIAPVNIGQIVIRNVCGCDSDIIITKNIHIRRTGLPRPADTDKSGRDSFFGIFRFFFFR
jgi:CxxC motif-containing protein